MDDVFIGCKGPIYCEAPVKPSGWFLWDRGYDGQVFWGQTAPPATIIQHAGDTRFETATKASQTAYPDPSAVDAVIISFSHNFPDALAASYLAGVANAPILLSPTDALHPATLAELNRLKPQIIYITGSTTVVGSGVEQALKTLSFKPTVTRLAGNLRTQTAVAIANEGARLRGTPQTAFVVYAFNYPDALSVGALSASRHVPILLTDKETLSPETQQYLLDNNIKDIIVIGGPPAVSDKVVTQLKGLSTKPTVFRWSGPDRYATAQDVITKATAKWNLKPTSVGIALGNNFPDALVGGAAMGNRGGILVISPPTTLSDAARTLITTNKDAIRSVEIFGGTNVIDVRATVQGLLS
jgi:putative cell wall-binding protein